MLKVEKKKQIKSETTSETRVCIQSFQKFVFYLKKIYIYIVLCLGRSSFEVNHPGLFLEPISCHVTVLGIIYPFLFSFYFK